MEDGLGKERQNVARRLFFFFFFFQSGEFLLHIPCCLDIYARSFSSGEFLLNILCWLYFYAWSLSYTSHADLVFMWGVSLTHPVLS